MSLTISPIGALSVKQDRNDLNKHNVRYEERMSNCIEKCGQCDAKWHNRHNRRVYEWTDIMSSNNPEIYL